MVERIPCMAVSQVTEPSLPRLIGPTGCRDDLAIVGTITQQEVNFVCFKGRGVLFVRTEEIGHTSRNRMLRINHFSPKSFQGSVADIAPADQSQVGAIVGIKAHGIVQVQKAPPLSTNCTTARCCSSVIHPTPFPSGKMKPSRSTTKRLTCFRFSAVSPRKSKRK